MRRPTPSRRTAFAADPRWKRRHGRALLLPLALASAGCTADPAGQRLTIATIATSNTFGGEALFAGKLIEREGCLVAVADGTFATPIFDPGVVLTPEGRAIWDVRQGLNVPIGRSFRAGAAWLRDDGRGWSVADIEAFYGTRIPAGCSTHDVIRLHDFVLED